MHSQPFSQGSRATAVPSVPMAGPPVSSLPVPGLFGSETDAARPYRQGFIDGCAGKLYYHASLAPVSSIEATGELVLFVPPIGEEACPARRFMAGVRQQLRTLGLDTLVVDAHGTGDSSGDFVDASWAIWCADLAGIAEMLGSHGVTRLHLVGMRAGCLLLAEAVGRHAIDTASISLMAPVVSGKSLVKNLLRTRIASSLYLNGETECPVVLRQGIAAGKSIEISGYEFSAVLLDSLAIASLDGLHRTTDAPVRLVETVADLERPASAPLARAYQKMQQAGCTVTQVRVRTPAFWQLYEYELESSAVAAVAESLAMSAERPR